tara:strand:- start:9439 stop:10071 length:633 start_codon:yes stop_codon:yes gene_type:complete
MLYTKKNFIMAIFTKETFEELFINVYEQKNIVKKNLDKVTDAFGLVVDIRPDIEKLIKYIIYMYDKNTPMRELYQELQERKVECALLSGYSEKKDKTILEELYNLTDKRACELISSFLKYQNHKSWALLVSNEEVLWQYQQELLNPITDFRQDKEKLQALEIKSKLMNECDSIIKRIEGYEEKIYGDDKKLKDAMKNITSPENIAYVSKT